MKLKHYPSYLLPSALFAGHLLPIHFLFNLKISFNQYLRACTFNFSSSACIIRLQNLTTIQNTKLVYTIYSIAIKLEQREIRGHVPK